MHNENRIALLYLGSKGAGVKFMEILATQLPIFGQEIDGILDNLLIPSHLSAGQLLFNLNNRFIRYPDPHLTISIEQEVNPIQNLS